jgi:hypothetical protein
LQVAFLVSKNKELTFLLTPYAAQGSPSPL